MRRVSVTPKLMGAFTVLSDFPLNSPSTEMRVNLLLVHRDMII